MNKNSEHIVFKNSMFDFDIANASSMYDCTGLIPFAPKNEAELDAYDDIMNYSAKDADIYRQSEKHEKSL